MDDRIWPSVSDARLVQVLQQQVAGALGNLHDCTEDGLGHLAKALDYHPDSEVTPHILRALTDLQKIDRAIQRLRNVADSMDEWSSASGDVPQDRPAWAEVMAERFVMPEEGSVLERILKK
ncbi:MAG TPA: hypothetical protein VJ961_03300 [Mariprofundaceae bacterium]|nr:hypothetical protein [Mariprofundaceae bacterium]